MKEYRLQVKVRLLTALNILNESLIYVEDRELDSRIADSASDHLSDTEIMAFFFLFKCVDTLEEARRKINETFGKNYPKATISTYGKRAIKKILKKCTNDKGLVSYVTRIAKKNTN